MSQVSMIAKITEYIVVKNELKKARQRARAKVNYYHRLFRLHGSSMTAEQAKARGIRGYSRWNKPGKKQILRLMYKKHLAEQLLIETKIHELVISSRKELINIKKSIPYTLSMSTDYIVGISTPDNYIGPSRIKEIYLDDRVEHFLLRSKQDAV